MAELRAGTIRHRWAMRHHRSRPGAAPRGAPRGRWGWGSWTVGDRCRWRGVRLICLMDHYAGDAAEHPWDPGWGWDEPIARLLWRPLTMRDRLLLRLVGRRTRGAA